MSRSMLRGLARAGPWAVSANSETDPPRLGWGSCLHGHSCLREWGSILIMPWKGKSSKTLTRESGGIYEDGQARKASGPNH